MVATNGSGVCSVSPDAPAWSSAHSATACASRSPDDPLAGSIGSLLFLNAWHGRCEHVAGPCRSRWRWPHSSVWRGAAWRAGRPFGIILYHPWDERHPLRMAPTTCVTIPTVREMAQVYHRNRHAHCTSCVNCALDGAESQSAILSSASTRQRRAPAPCTEGPGC